MKLTKILSVLLVLVFALSAIACTDLENTNETDSETTTQTEENTTQAEETTAAEETTEEETTAAEETTEEETTEAEETTEEETTEAEETTEEETTEAEEIQTITIAEALALCGEPGHITTERYYIRALVKTVTNAQYGSMVIYDETGEISVYGTYSADGELYYSDLADKPVKGDEVLLHCILQNYNGTKEVKNARLIEFVSNQGNFDASDYTAATIAEARAAAEGAKLKVSGIVARITYSTGMKPNGFILVNGADSIYVYDGDTAGRVSIGNRIEIAASKTYWVLDTEQSNANMHGYKGCNQLESATLLSNDNGNNGWTDASFPTITVKEIMDNPVSNDITTQIYKVTALVKKAPGNGFINYYINDLDGTTGSYVYTQCNGNDFAWLDEFDGKICTVYLVALNAKSTVSGCVYRFLPVAVVDEGFVFNTNDSAQYSVIYHGLTQFDTFYTGNPAIEVVTTVSSQLLGFENAALTYASSNNNVISFVTANGKTVMNCVASGTATITVTGSYNGIQYSGTITVTVDIPQAEIPSITVGDAIDAAVGTEVVVKGIVGPSLVNQTGFYLIDETGVIAVVLSSAELEKVQPGNEIILKGTRAIRVKDGSSDFGQANLDACEIITNNYGEHSYSDATFITDKTLADFSKLNAGEDHGAEVYVLTVSIKLVEEKYYSNIYITSGSTEVLLYCSSANQYNWLKAYAGQTVTVEVAPCNWNSKGSYRGCVLAVVNEDGSKVCNELNFSK